MSIAVVNAHLANYEPLAALTTWGNRTAYCKLHGYDLHVKTDGWKYPARHPTTYDRLAFMLDLLKTNRYQWIWCSGTDTFHTNFQTKLESFIDPAFHVIASPDWCVPFQADSFFVRNSPEGILWLSAMLASYPKYKDHVWVENAAIVDTFEEWKPIIKILPQRELNAYHYPLFWQMYRGEHKVKHGLDFFGNDGQWKRGDFLIHWPSLPLDQRITLAKVYEKFITR